MQKIFVGNLAWKVSEEELKALFEKHGTVTSIRIIIDQYTGKSRGFAFVEMGDKDQAANAIKALNGFSLKDRELRVSIANEPTPGSRPPRGDRGDRGGDRGERRGGDRGDRYEHRSERAEKSYR